MKAIKYVVMGVLMLGMSTSVMAQEAELNAAIQAVKSNAANKADLVKTAQKKNKKDPQALVALGRALYEAKDTAQARVCANMANEAVKPKFSYAPAYLLLGDIESLGDDGGLNYLFYGHSNDIGLSAVYGETEGYDEFCDAVISFYEKRVLWIDEQMARESGV